MAAILIRYWAGAKAAAGVEIEQIEATSVESALALAVGPERGELARILKRSSFWEYNVPDVFEFETVAKETACRSKLSPFSFTMGSNKRAKT